MNKVKVIAMFFDNWVIDLDEVIDANYADGTVLRLRDLIVFALEHPNETRQKFNLKALSTQQDAARDLSTRVLSEACPDCGGTEWRCADCQDRQASEL